MLDFLLAHVRTRRVARLRPIFIVGCGHSGTTLLAAMLDSHPRMMSFEGESNAFLMRRWKTSAPRILGKFANRVRRAGAARLCEKTPRHVRYLDRIFSLFPEARVVYLTRDGRDVAFSIAKRTGSIEDGATRWLEDNELGLQQSVGNPRVHMVRYEALVAQPRETLESICAFVGEAFDPAMLDYANRERKWYGVETVADPGAVHVEDKAEQLRRHNLRRNWQINQPLFDGRGKWRELDSQTLAALEARIEPMMHRLGYA